VKRPGLLRIANRWCEERKRALITTSARRAGRADHGFTGYLRRCSACQARPREAELAGLLQHGSRTSDADPVFHLTRIKTTIARRGEHAISQHPSDRHETRPQMEFHIALTETCPGPDVIQDAMFDVDPNAVVDLDMSGLVMRISSCVTVTDLVELLRRTGWTVAPERVAQLPTLCCGGCSG
jgi:hypothetical protein